MTVLVAAAVIIEDGRVLLTQRMRGAHLEQLWEFPGGKVEPGESPEDALVREMREETALDVVVDGILDVTFWRYPARDVLLLFYRAHRTANSPAIEHREVAAHVWAEAAALGDYALPPADVPVLAKVRALLAR